MELDEIRAIVELMDKYNLSEFKVEADEMHLCMKRETGVVLQPAAIPTAAYMPHPTSVPAAAPAEASGAQSPVADEKRETINAPIVGTFYKSSSPDSEAYVKVGDKVEADTIVGIIEAMKVMNEIKAEKSGTIKEILIENAESVEYGTPLFVIE